MDNKCFFHFTVHPKTRDHIASPQAWWASLPARVDNFVQAQGWQQPTTFLGRIANFKRLSKPRSQLHTDLRSFQHKQSLLRRKHRQWRTNFHSWSDRSGDLISWLGWKSAQWQTPASKDFPLIPATATALASFGTWLAQMTEKLVLCLRICPFCPLTRLRIPSPDLPWHAKTCRSGRCSVSLEWPKHLQPQFHLLFVMDQLSVMETGNGRFNGGLIWIWWHGCRSYSIRSYSRPHHFGRNALPKTSFSKPMASKQRYCKQKSHGTCHIA